MCGISLVVQLLRLYASNAADVGSIPDYGTTFLHAMERGQKKKKKKEKNVCIHKLEVRNYRKLCA